MQSRLCRRMAVAVGEDRLEHPAGPARYDDAIGSARCIDMDQRFPPYAHAEPNPWTELQAVDRRHEGLALEHSTEVEERGTHKLDAPCRANQTTAQLHRPEFDSPA